MDTPSLWDVELPHLPVVEPDGPPVPVFTADQVGAAIAAALDAQASGADPAEAASAALTPTQENS